MSEDIKTSDTMKQICLLLYFVYAVSPFLQTSVSVMLMGMVVTLAAVFAAYAVRSKAKGTLYETHIQWIIRTFWIGTGVYMPILTVLGFVVIYSGIDYDALFRAMETGEILDPNELAATMLENNSALIWRAMLVTALPFTAWWWWRCWKGFNALQKQQPVDKVESWM